ncbi:MAG TPA: MBOAT family protein [Usitatibacter sp.]|nr:MBOAT family protein [Usitatibacter sp.]
MLFNSYAFILAFLPVVVLGFYLLGRIDRRVAAGWLVLASFFFYGWWSAKYVPLLAGSAIVNFVAGASIARDKSRRVLSLAVAANLLLLGFFKYADFFIDTANRATGSDFPLLGIVLPIGISFYTFTQIAYLVDAYRGHARDYDFVHYLLFVSYFPHLIAGPLLHHAQVMPQFDDPRTYRPRLANINVGLVLFSVGLFKKVVLADEFATIASPIFDHAAAGTTPALASAWIAALAYALQIYFDFSGYSDMALGISRLFNVRLPVNFFSPYRAPDAIHFWRRWHMTLSAFLRDYLYIPLGGNRQGKVRRYLNLMITMVLGGLWHGASWTFVAWGALHGAYLVVNHGWRALRERLGLPALPFVVGITVTFTCVVVAWVPFRAADFATALRMLEGMAGVQGSGWAAAVPNLWPFLVRPTLAPELSQGAWLALGLAIVFLLPSIYTVIERRLEVHEASVTLPRSAAWVALAAGVLFFVGLKTLSVGAPSPFLYFQF